MSHDRALLPRTKAFAADAIDRRVSARLAARRRQLGIDRGLLDLTLEVSDGTVERLETGRARIAPSHLFRLADILNVSVDWFFADADAEAPPAEPLFSSDNAERQAESRTELPAHPEGFQLDPRLVDSSLSTRGSPSRR
ncbi:MAG: helix-turn-helix domain-containing protein [Hyphomicrobiales bacterium]